MLDLEKLILPILELVSEVGAFQVHERSNFRNDAIEEKDFNNLVSYVDIESEKMLVNGLSQILPNSGFLTEEKTTEQKNSEGQSYWIIDPLDGTTNYMHKLPLFAISVALIQNDKIVLGVIYEPLSKEMFWAIQGKGAFLNNNPIRCTKTPVLSKTLIATGFPYYAFEKTEKYLKTLSYFMQHTRGVRRMGAAAIDLAYVAVGRFDGFYEYNLNAWDVAAGILLVEEAGGKVTTFSGESNALFGREILATNGLIHADMSKIISVCFQ